MNHQKENKEKKNREKLMTNPGSQYSLSTQEEMEMDYYDYNVINASAAPGSYLGMDPAFLVWIPPIDESGKILSDSENEDFLPVHFDVNPGSNRESPNEVGMTKIPLKPPRKTLKSTLSDEEELSPRSAISKDIICKLNLHQMKYYEKSNESNEDSKNQEPCPEPDKKRMSQVIEKETIVIKSPSDNKISEYYELSDIKFADEEEDAGDSSFSDKTFAFKS